MAATLKSNIVATLGEFGDFDEYNGGAVQIAHTDYTAAGRKAPEKLTGTHSLTDITLTRAFDPKRDNALKDWFNKYQQGKETGRAVTVKHRNSQGVVINTDTYPDCRPLTYTPAPGKSGDNSVADITIALGCVAVQ